MTKQPLTRINYNIPMGLYQRLVSTSEREGRPLTTIVVCALEAYISQSDWTSAGVSPERLNASPTLIILTYTLQRLWKQGGMIRRVLRPGRPGGLGGKGPPLAPARPHGSDGRQPRQRPRPARWQRPGVDAQAPCVACRHGDRAEWVRERRGHPAKPGGGLCQPSDQAHRPPEAGGNEPIGRLVRGSAMQKSGAAE